jgi:ADP-heptose:LPS heptosyltransferase
LTALVRRSALCLSNDSGPMHLAVALGRPVVSIFGPTDPVWAGPYRRGEAVLKADLACSPCYLRQLSRCPNAHACMQQISAAAVIDRVEKALQQRTGNAPKVQANRR